VAGVTNRVREERGRPRYGTRRPVDGGSLRVTPASALTPDDRAAIRGNLNDLIAALAPEEPWNLAEAIRLMDEADALVERLAAPGSHPAIQAAAEMAASAFRRHDVLSYRTAVAKIVSLARQLGKPELPGS
jgi:hypothetical protein